MSAPPPTKIIIIGAGWSGLVTAKTYLQLASSPDNPKSHPIDLTVLDDSKSPGGVWSSSRLYPGLLANSPNGLYEYSDFSMVDEEHPDLELITGGRVQEYLEGYAKRFGVYEKIRFGVTVSYVRRRIETGGDGWDVETSTGEILTCDKLIVASGLHSKPKLPPMASSSTYDGVSIHSKLLGQTHQQLSKDPTIKDIVIVGGCKSAVEAVSLFLDAPTPKCIHWVVRPSEQGVPMVAHNPDMRPNLIAVNNTRAFSAFSPSVFTTSGFWYRWLHSGVWLPGTLLMKFFWMFMSFFIKSQVGYGKSRNGKSIEPEGNSLFFDGSYISIVLQDSKFFKVLHADDFEKLEVRRAKPLELKGKHMLVQDKVLLDHGAGWYMCKKEIKADAVIWCTGWQPSMDYFDEREEIRLGLPHSTSSSNEEDEEAWARIAEASNKEVQRLLPYLSSNKRKPRKPSEPILKTPFRLYNQILPISCLESRSHPADRSIAFTCLTQSSQTAIVSELCALYAVAWLEDLIPRSKIPNRTECMMQVSMTQSWMSMRYGIRGLMTPEIIIEIQGFLDRICTELGLEVERKKKQGKGWMREWFEPYRASDYQGVIGEFLKSKLD